MRTAGFVLVGGKSRRMGRNKAFLPWQSGVLAGEIARCAAAAAGPTALIGDPDLYGALGYECIPDMRPGRGPLAGIETALEARRAHWNLVLACDMPGLDVTHLRDLLSKATDTQALCTVSVDPEGKLHPLCAVYHCDCLPAVKLALDEGRLRLTDLVRTLKAELVPSGHLPNVNTMEEWNAIRVN